MDESQLPGEIIRQKCPIMFFWKFIRGSEKHLKICTYPRISVNTYAYEKIHSVEKLCALRHCTVCFNPYMQAHFLGTKHGPEAGQGDNKATVNAQHTSNTINAVVRASIEMSSLLLRRNDENSVTYGTTLTNSILYTITHNISIEEHFIED